MPVALKLTTGLQVVISEGQLIAGGSLSFTVTVNEHVLVLPAASVATKVLVVTPTGNVPPLAIPDD